MRVCVSLLQQSQVDCSAVPISVELFAPSQDNWYLRLYVSVDPIEYRRMTISSNSRKSLTGTRRILD